MEVHRIKINSFKYENRYRQLAEDLDAILKEDCEEFLVEFQNTFGTGMMRGINFKYGLNLQMINALYNTNSEICYDLGRRHPIMFLYVKEGYVELHTNSDSFVQKVNANEAVIFAPQGDSTYSINIPSNVKVKLAQANIVRYLFLQKIECDLDTIPSPLQEMFKDTRGEKAFYYKTATDPSIANAVTNLFKNDQTGLERKLHLESYATKMVTSLIKSFRIETNPANKGYLFTKAHIRLINEAKSYILTNLTETPTVKTLSLRLGINTNKLQKGFHLLFDKSVRQFIISAKLHAAQQLIGEGDLTISEIANHLGYTNKGHFSKLFKKEFGILPSEYNIRFRKY